MRSEQSFYFYVSLEGMTGGGREYIARENPFCSSCSVSRIEHSAILIHVYCIWRRVGCFTSKFKFAEGADV